MNTYKNPQIWKQKIKKRETKKLKNVLKTHVVGISILAEKDDRKIIFDRKIRRQSEKPSITGHNGMF